MFFLILAFVLFTTTFLIWWGLIRGREKGDGRHSYNVYQINSDDKEMNEAIERARKSIDDFISRLNSYAGGGENFELKARFEENGENEHLWLKNLSYENGFFKGVIANNPVILREYTYGQDVFVPLKDVTDWMIIDNGVMKGGYTIKVLLNNMSEEERKAFLDKLNFTIA